MKKIFTFIIAIICLTALAPQAVAQWSGGGLGSLDQPYLINNETELAQLAADVNGGTDYAGKYFRLEVDLDLSSYGSAYNGGKGWIPVGTNLSFSFRGHFDGNGKTISNLFIDDSDLDNAGLFGYVSSGSVTKLGLVDVNITGKDHVGGLAGHITGDIENCYVTGEVSGNIHVGGLVGISGCNITNCYSTGEVFSTGSSVGGLAGSVTGHVGGVGFSLTNCYSSCDVIVTGNGAAGGLVGYMSSIAGGSISITDCYATGDVSASAGSSIGGIVGRVESNAGTSHSIVTNCYATGALSGYGSVGGVAGNLICVSSGNISISHCAALNPSVAATIYAGRVASHTTGDNFVLSDNIAWENMEAGDSPFVGDNTGNGLGGADVSPIFIYENPTLGDRFTSSGGWTTAAGKLPGFGEAISMLPHLLIPLTIIPEAGQSKVYGDDDTLRYTISGWQGDDGDHPEDFVSVTLARSPGEDVDADGDGDVDEDDFYAIYAGEVMSLTEQGAAKYSLSLAEGAMFSITPATLTLTPDDASKVFGDPDPANLTYTASGWKFTDAGTFNVTIGREAGENVGEYEIGISAAALSAPNTNYILAYDATGAFTITPKPAPVNWPNLSLTYGGVPLAPYAEASDKDGAPLTITVSGAQTAVGTGYKAVANCADPNYKLTGDTAYFSIAKAVGEPLSSEVVLDSATYNSITVLAIADASNGQTAEYAISETAGSPPTSGWQDSPTFTGLQSSHSYYIYARTAENESYESGGVPKQSEALYTDIGITGVTIAPDTASIRKGDTLRFTAVVSGGATVPKTVNWYVDGAAHAGTTVDANGLLTVHADESASAFTVRAVSIVDTDKADTARISLYRRTTMDNGTVVITPPGGDPNDNPDGSITLPDGGTVIPPVEGEPVDAPEEDGKVEIEVPPGTVVDNDGKTTLPPSDGGTATYPDTGTEIDLPPGTVIDGDGKIVIPDDGDATVTYPGDGTEIDLPPSTEIEVDDEGRIVITPGDDGATVDPGDGSPDVTVPGDGSEIIIDPNDGVQVVRVPQVAMLTHIPDPMTAVYNGAPQPITVTASAEITGTITVYYNGSATAPTNAGTYAITVDVAASPTNKAASGLALGDYTVTKKPVAVVWGATSLPYNGAPQKPTATASDVNGDPIALTITGEQTEIGAGYPATADFAVPSANYTLTNTGATFAIVINPTYEYSVTFDSQGGSAVDPQAITHGNAVEQPEDPTLEGFVLTGWFTTAECNAADQWDFSLYRITSDTILYAGWTRRLLQDAELGEVIIDGQPVHESLFGDRMNYMTDCGATSVEFKITASDSARIFVDGVRHAAVSSVTLTGEVTYINIRIESESGTVTNDFTVTVAAALPAYLLYYQRWSDVLAINHNPMTNGGRTITGVRWFHNGEQISEEQFVRYAGSGYSAEVETNGLWHKVCSYVSTRSDASAALSASPNPVSRGEALTFQLPEQMVGGKLDIYSIAGSLVKTGIALPTAQTSVNLTELPAGIYLFKLTAKDGVSETVKIIIN